jgi:hypothetical protein
MANTTNFNWETPDDTDLVKDGAAAMRTLGNSIDTSFVDLKGGTTGQVLAKASGTDLDYTWTTPTSAVQFAPNLAINGAFIVNQRGYTSTTNLASGAYGFDRWKSNYTNTALTFTAGINSTTVTISTSGGLQQVVERENVPAGTYTLSWSGTATGRVYNSGGTPPSYAASPVTFTADGTTNVVLEFTASGSTKTLSLVKFERGSSATTYSLAGGTYAGELAACQRYYFQDAAAVLNAQQAVAATTVYGVYYLPVVMRSNPTLTQTGSSIASSNTAATSFTYDASAASPNKVAFYVTGGASTGQVYLYRPIQVSAEL